MTNPCNTVRHMYRVIGTYRRTALLTRGFSSSNYTAGIMAPIKAGDSVPNVNLFDGTPDNKVNAAEAYAKGTHVIFGIPGAFTPTCQNEHFPSFLTDFDKLKAKGVDTVTCVSVNDPFVMEAFGKAIGAQNKVRCLADTCGEFTKAIDLALDATGILGNVRSQRYAMVVKDGKVAAINVDENPAVASCSKASGVLDLL